MDANVASAPDLTAPGWVAQSARWLTVAVAMASRQGQMVMTAPPALVGSPPAAAAPPAVGRGSGGGDAGTAAATRDTVERLLRAYGSGDLEFVRAAGAGFAGLNGAAELHAVTGWRVAELADGTDGSTRVGDVTVTWTLPAAAGRLTCSYRIELQHREGRWYLAGISPAIEEIR